MAGAVRFLWNATRGNRLRPWRSEYLKWRMETYSGMKTESIGAREFFRFAWSERVKLVSFLRWTGQMRSLAAPRAAASRAEHGAASPRGQS